MGRIRRSIGPQALSLLTHSAIQRRQALQRDAHEQRKYDELVRRKHDRSKVVASPERIREAGGGGIVSNSGSPRDLLFAIDEGSHNTNPPSKTNMKSAANMLFHSVAAGANAAPKAFKAIRQYKSRFGRSETTSLRGLVDDDEVVVGDSTGGTVVVSNSLVGINNSLLGIASVDGGTSMLPPTPPTNYHSPSPTKTTTMNTLAIVPRWKKMADARPPIPIRPDSSTLLHDRKKDYRHPASPSKGTNHAPSTTSTTAPVRITQDSRPEWYKDRQELEAVMRRRILSSESHMRNDVLVDAFFEPQGSNRAVVKNGGFPVMGLVAENIVNTRREKQRAAIYKKELGDDW